MARKVLDNFFDRVAIIGTNGGGRVREYTDRLIEYQPIDGALAGPPPWWLGCDAAWGCLLSHVHVVTEARDRGAKQVLVFEDDAIFAHNFAATVNHFMQVVPEDWGQIYFGGQHRGSLRSESVNGVVVPRRVNRCHAYAVSAGAFTPFLEHVTNPEWYKRHGKRKMHIDHCLEFSHIEQKWPVYAPRTWVVGQGAGVSTITGHWAPERWWND